MRRRSATRFRDRPSSIMTARCSVGPERSLTLSGDVPGFSRRKEGSTMATTYCCPGRSPLKFVSPTSRSSAPSAAAFVCAGRAIASPLLKASQPLGGRGRGSLPRQRLQVLCGAAPVTQAEFPDAVLKSDVPVLVEFVADWCGPCRLISSVIEWASQEYEGRIKVVKIDHDANPQLIEEYKVYGLPALILFKDGREVPESRREGAITKAKLKEYLDSLLDSAVA